MITAPQLPGAMLAGLSRLSIPARLVLLATALLLILIGTNTYLNLELKRGADTLVAEARYVDALRRANAAEKSFGDLKYWLTDSAVSQLNLSEQRAQEARHALDDQLKNLAGDDPATVSAIRNEVEQLMSRAQQAINAYADDRRVIGNSLMAVARTHIVAVEQKLAHLAAKPREDTGQGREAGQSRAWTTGAGRRSSPEGRRPPRCSRGRAGGAPDTASSGTCWACPTSCCMVRQATPISSRISPGAVTLAAATPTSRSVNGSP